MWLVLSPGKWKQLPCNAVLLLLFFSFVIKSATQLHVPNVVCLSATLADQQLSQVPSAPPFPFQAFLYAWDSET